MFAEKVPALEGAGEGIAVEVDGGGELSWMELGGGEELGEGLGWMMVVRGTRGNGRGGRGRGGMALV